MTVNNNAGGQSSSSFTVTVSADITAPSGGTVSYTNGYSTNAAVNVSFTKGTDSGSGLAAGSGVLQRSVATLSNGSCGSFGPFTTIVSNPASAYSDPVTTACYQYHYLISDNAGNQATYTTPSIVKMDQIPPTNTISITSATGAVSRFGGATLYYKGDAPGSFKYVDAVADAESGPASADFPNISATGWTHAAETVSTPAGGPYVSSTYSWTSNPSVPALQNVVGRDAAGKIWNAAITFVSDTSAPTGVGISYPSGIVNTPSVPITPTAGYDSQSGVNIAASIVNRDTTSLDTTTDTCGAFPGTFAATVTLVGGADTSASNAHCYQYRYLSSDSVGNVATFTSPNIVKLDTTTPSVTAIASFQSGGVTSGDGQLQGGDQLRITFNENLAPASVPTTVSGATEARVSNGHVMLTIPGITNGALDTGSSNYLAGSGTTKTATFAGTVALNNNGASTTITLTVTGLSGDPTGSANGQLTFLPATTITNAGGTGATGPFVTNGGGFKLF